MISETAAHLAAVYRALGGFNPGLAAQALETARTLYVQTMPGEEKAAKTAQVHAAAELFLSPQAVSKQVIPEGNEPSDV